MSSWAAAMKSDGLFFHSSLESVLWLFLQMNE